MEIQEIRLKALEIAERSVHQPYVSGAGNNVDYYRDKDLKEIISRANRLISFVLDDQTETERTLIEKLKGVLCEG